MASLQFYSMCWVLGHKIPKKIAAQLQNPAVHKHRELLNNRGGATSLLGGFGTARFDTVENRHDELLACAYSGVVSCMCCGKDKSPYMDYHTSIGGYLCSSCKKKVQEYSLGGVVDALGLLVANGVLEEERELSRLANAAYNSGPYSREERLAAKQAATAPVCPRCLNQKVSKVQASKLYWCDHCGYFHYANKKYYWNRGGTVYKSTADKISSKIIYATPLIKNNWRRL